MIKVVLKGLAGRKLRALLTAVAIILGVAMISGTYVLTDTINAGFTQVFTTVYAKTDAVITGKSLVSSSGNAVAPSFDAARDAWRRAGRQGPPRLLALAYFALGDSDKGRRNVYEYYSLAGGEFAGIVAGAVCDSPATVRERISSLADIGVDEISFITGTDDLDEVKRLADIVF